MTEYGCATWMDLADEESPAVFIELQVTSVLGSTVTDTIQSTSGGSGHAQFPAYAVAESAPDPASGPASSTIASGGRRLLLA